MTSAANPFLALEPETMAMLPASERFPAAGHLWSREEIDALILAWAARRPLLVRGEAGSGKSQIARAAAQVLGDDNLLVEVIHPRFEALDLLYHLDVVARLSDAQIPGALDPTNDRYVRRGRLWQAMIMQDQCSTIPVLLIDEIDKADADVPNALLDVLGNRSFTVPPLNHKVVSVGDKRLPLVIITTNEERELPPAFVRRCVVLNLSPPDGEQAFIDWLVRRGRVHSHLTVTDAARSEAAAQVQKDRTASVRAGYPPVGLAEYVDLLAALHELTQDEPEQDRAARQVEWLRRISVYALVKHAGQRQAPVSAASGQD